MMCLCRHFEGGRRRRRRAKLVREKQTKPDRDNSFDLADMGRSVLRPYIFWVGRSVINLREGGA
jgi:hypothetical protein